jgi:poly(3-hydroxybutyrate) depolymerase
MATAGASGRAAVGGTAMPSPGCLKVTARPQGGTVTQSDRIYSFPAAYDGKTPMPLLLGLHAAGNPNTQLQNLTKGSKLETEFVRIFPKSAGSAWVYDTDVAKLNGVLDEVLSTYCVDTSRMFATGHSSGAQMVVQMLCKGEKRFKAVAPVAASKYCSSFAPVPALYIQGMMDAQRGGGNGMDVVTMFTTSNGCSTQTMAKPDVQPCTSTFDHMQVTPGCVTYQGCKASTIWCSHNDNGYNNSDGRQHGWPCFASAAIAEFFLGQP